MDTANEITVLKNQCKELENRVLTMERKVKKEKEQQIELFVILCIIIFNAVYTLLVVMK